MRLFLLSLSVLLLAGCVTTQSRYDHYQTRYNAYDGTYYAQDRYGHGDYYYQDDRSYYGHSYGNYGHPYYSYGSLWPFYSYHTPWYSRSMYHHPYRRSSLGVWFNLSNSYSHAWYSPWRYNGYYSGYYSPYVYAYPYANGYYYGDRRRYNNRQRNRRPVYDDRYGNAQNEAARIRDDLATTQRRTYNDRSWSSAGTQRVRRDRYDRFEDTNPQRGALLDRGNVRGADIGVRGRNNQVRTSTGWHRVDRNDRLPFGMTRDNQRSNLSAADRVRLESIRMRNSMPSGNTSRRMAPVPRSRAATSLQRINQPTHANRPAPINRGSSGMFQARHRAPQPTQPPAQQAPQQRVRMSDMMSRPAPSPSFNQPKPRPVQRAVFSQPRAKPAPRPRSSSSSSDSSDRGSSVSRGSLLRRN